MFWNGAEQAILGFGDKGGANIVESINFSVVFLDLLSIRDIFPALLLIIRLCFCLSCSLPAAPTLCLIPGYPSPNAELSM